jgi:HAD superfamily hydrolase (TIGR01509 family)
MKFNAILFDCDGVLVDSEAITIAVIAETLNAYGGKVTTSEAMTAFLGRSLRENSAIVAQLIGQHPPESFFNDFLEARDRALAARVEAVLGITEVIAAIQAKNIPLAVASGADVHKMNITLGRTGLLPAFTGRIFGNDHVARSKPAPDVYLFAANALGINPADCIVIEDTPTGVAAGVAAGAKVIAYAGALHSDADALLAAGAIAVIRDMTVLHELLNL